MHINEGLSIWPCMFFMQRLRYECKLSGGQSICRFKGETRLSGLSICPDMFLCGGSHMSVDCQVGNPFIDSSAKQGHLVPNFSILQYNSYSSIYDPGWENHLNFSWSKTKNA